MIGSPQKRPEPLPEVWWPKTDDKLIIIHVIDTNQNQNEDFYCNKALILKEMKYFDRYTK